MNQTANIAAALAAVMPAVRASGLLSSLCTIERPTTAQGFSGSPDGSYEAVAGLSSIACRIAPMSEGSPSATEQRASDETKSEEPKHVLLDAYYPTVRTAWLGDPSNGTLGGARAVIDGQPYTILGVEPDGSYQMTRMAVEACQI